MPREMSTPTRNLDRQPRELQLRHRRLGLVVIIQATQPSDPSTRIGRPGTMTPDRIWHGTSTEWNELGEAVKHNCTCGERTYSLAPRCSVHQLLHEQRALDRLLFARRIAATLIQEEMAEDSVASVQH